MKIKDGEGKEIEVFTGEEVEAKVKEAETKASTDAVEAYKKDHPDQSEAIEGLKTQLTEAQQAVKAAEEKLEAAQSGGGDDDDKDGQVKRLETEVQDAKKKLTEATDALTRKVDGIQETAIGDIKSDALKALTGDDEELRKKVLFHYDRFAEKPTSKEKIVAQMAEAYTLATGNKPTPGMLDGRSSAGGKGDGPDRQGPDNETDNSKEIRKALGVTDEQRKKYLEKKQGRSS